MPRFSSFLAFLSFLSFFFFSPSAGSRLQRFGRRLVDHGRLLSHCLFPYDPATTCWRMLAISIVDRPMSRAPNMLRRPDLWLAAMLAAPGLTLAAPPLFEDETMLALKLEAPFRTILRDRDDPEYQPARIVTADDKAPKSRSICGCACAASPVFKPAPFPPILLNFPGEQPAGSPFAVENRLKLVTYCNESPGYEQYVRLERQAYLVLNLLTGTSLRTRLVNVTYYDTRTRPRARDQGRLPDRGRGSVRRACRPHARNGREDRARKLRSGGARAGRGVSVLHRQYGLVGTSATGR